MRAGLAVVMTLATAGLAAGCYHPSLKNFGFQCDSTAPKPCPDGYICRNGYCDDGTGGQPPGGTGGNGTDDMAMSQGGGGGGGGGGSAGGGGGGGGQQQDDMAMSVQDMAHPVQDLAQPPADMTQTSSCAHDECTTGVKLTKTCSQCANDVCTNDSYCCNTKWDQTCITDVGLYCTTKTCP